MSDGTDLQRALKDIGIVSLYKGVWRLFSDEFPLEGIESWNDKSAWRLTWGASVTGLVAFGEDLFGNQLVFRRTSEGAFLWNHENGELNDLLLDPITLLETVLECGLDWIDFYSSESIAVAQNRILDVPLECHLHWTTPLILGGQPTIQNTSVVERKSHLIGHAKLWRQLQDFPPGTIIIP